MGHLTTKTSTSTNDNNQINGVKATPRFSNNLRHIAKLTAETLFIFTVSYLSVWGLMGVGYAMGKLDASRDVLSASNDVYYVQKVDSTNTALKLTKDELL